MDERALTNQHMGQKEYTSQVCVCTRTPTGSYISRVLCLTIGY